MEDHIERRIKPWKLILIITSCLAVVISFALISHYNKQANYESSFGDFLNEGKYGEALDLYREIQNLATDDNTLTKEKERYRNLQSSYEIIVEEKVEKIIERLKLGDSLNSEDKDFISKMQEVTSASISPILNRETEAWLDGTIDFDRWKHIISSFENFPNLKVNVDNLLNQEENLKEATIKFTEASKYENINEWSTAWQKWQEIADDSKLGRFAQEYAEFRLKIFQEDIYKDLISLADQHIAGERYYSAKLILDRLFDTFPNEVEISEKLQICNDKLPNKINVWEGQVEHIAIRPLVTDIDRAINGPYKTFAETGLLSTTEFRSLLDELYANNYVLVSGETFMNYPEEYPQVIVPSGKKPLVMIFNQYQYSTQYKESGTPEQLAYDEESNQFVSRLTANKIESTVENQDAISILENFISEQTDFSFNGAKARIALTIDENILGYTINDDQTQNIINKNAELGLEDFILTDKSPEERSKYYQLQTEDLQKLFAALKQRGFTFCNGTYGGEDLSVMTHDNLEDNINSWNELMIPFLGEVRSLVFPGGANVYNSESKLQLLLDLNYCTFYGEGPNTYNFYANTYLHFDFTSINGSTLESAEHWNLDRFLNRDSVLENWRQ